MTKEISQMLKRTITKQLKDILVPLMPKTRMQSKQNLVMPEILKLLLRLVHKNLLN